MTTLLLRAGRLGRGASDQFEDEGAHAEWTARPHRPIYRTLIAAAALAGAYQEPIFAARERPDMQFLVPGSASETDDRVTKLNASNCYRGYDFLQQFAVCNTVTTLEADDEAREAMARRFRESTRTPTWSPGRSQRVIADSGGVSRECPHAATAASGERPRADCQAVLFGVCNTEDIYFPPSGYGRPASLGQPEVRLSYVPLKAAEKYEDEGGMLLWVSTAAIYCRRVKECSDQPNSGCAAGGDRNSSLPPLELKFFDYFARRYLGLRHLSRP
ncbi:hypothetical protein C8A05DRAFT_38190, partial [Staphylotrichum tortipilum]